MDPVAVKLPIHSHCSVTPLKDDRIGKCCGIKFEGLSDGYYCSEYGNFFHKKCANAPLEINHPSHECNIALTIDNICPDMSCTLCGGDIIDGSFHYMCDRTYCRFRVHLYCGKYPPPEVIGVPQHHDHKLKLEMIRSCFTCATCGKEGDEYPYKCHECDLAFHVNCEKYGAEVNHPLHSLHPLKLLKGEPPAYSDGKCHLCAKIIIDEAFYHCSTCNITLDVLCVHDPPQLYLENPNIHAHQLTLMPLMVSFTCITCGLKGDRSPYVCLQCNFIVHNDCSSFPWVININRHDHRVSRTSLLGVVDSVCGVCRKKMDWSCGGYSCQRCPPGFVFHTKCATRKDVWDGKEMKGTLEEDEDIEPYMVIDENTIRHYSHPIIGHDLRLDESGVFVEGRGSCEACVYPIYHDSFYSCISCDFFLHETCAKMPKWKRHVVSTKRFRLSQFDNNYSKCEACGVCFNGFVYGKRPSGLDMRCASISGAFVHQSHPHPLFYTSPKGVCSSCKKEASHVLRCVEDDCEYVLDFKCALLPYEAKHRVDDHFLSLCFGEKEDATGKYWCDICEKETNPKNWFYTCKDCGLALHTNCVLGDFRGLKPRKQLAVVLFRAGVTVYLTVRNNSMSRPLCCKCKSRCIFPIILASMSDDEEYVQYHCSIDCCHIENVSSGCNKYFDRSYLI